MAFAANPLALSVPEPAFESWLRDSGYLDILDQKTSDLHRISTTTTATTSTTAATNPSAAGATTTAGFFLPYLSCIGTLLSLFTFNPFSKLTADDFNGDTPSWTTGFVGSFGSYSLPSSPSQARLRVHENIPLALVGLVSSLALWDAFRVCGERWGIDRHPLIRQTLVLVAQITTAVVLFLSNVQMALLCALGFSYAVLILHASFRKLTPAKQPAHGRRK
ncbi:hypothetical protein RJ639_033371 [Escallonia herrerae]|uniref:PRA1 family protein n=1 Tax=Escallonia herrerae TaxID=1293975 RepID=A0AA89BC23_9ASTE|nr:hypothetical protein RJ639_033371 [Escallonia herrerae]